MRLILKSLLGITTLILSSCGIKDEVVTIDESWDKASSFLVNDANRSFRLLVSQDKENTRETRLGLAITLLDVQPKLARNLEFAKSLLEELIAEDNSDDVGVFARFTLGRFLQLHAPNPDLYGAMGVFSSLFDEHPHLLIAQQAFATYAMISLSPKITSDDLVGDKIAELNERAQRLTFPEAETMFHLAIAYATNLRGIAPEATIRHMKAAQELGIMEFRRLGESYLITGNLALKIGDIATANEQFSRFVKEIPRDVRNYTVQEILNEINNVPNASGESQ